MPIQTQAVEFPWPDIEVAPTVLTATATLPSTPAKATTQDRLEITAAGHTFLRTALTGANNDLDFIARKPGLKTHALATTAMPGTNNDVTLTANAYGEKWNGYKLRILNTVGQISATLTVTVNGTEIEVAPATDASGVVTSTGANLVTALNANATLSPNFTAANAGGNDGTGLIAAWDGATTSGGISADDITITYTISGGTSTVASVVTTGNAIVVTAGSATTAASVQSAIQSDATAGKLVVVNNATGNDGTGAIIALTATNLADWGGTTPTVDITLQESSDEKSTWHNIKAFGQMTGANTGTKDAFVFGGDYGRWNIVVAGTNPVVAISIQGSEVLMD